MRFDLREDGRRDSALRYKDLRFDVREDDSRASALLYKDLRFWEVDIGARLWRGFCWSVGKRFGIVEGLF